MKILFTSYYKDKSEVRQQELELCIQMNILNENIDKIYIFLEGNKKDFPILIHDKIIIVETKRPTYKMFFDFINQTVSDDHISMIANTDIFFDETINLLDEIEMKNTCVALSRWHYHKDHSIALHNEKFSQDVWIFKGKIKPITFCSFFLGIRGCDNRIAYEINKAGYKLINPAKTIKSFHYHLSDLHNYGNEVVPRPHLPIEVTELKTNKQKV